MRATIQREIAILLGVKEEEVLPEAHLVNDLGADSLDHVEICMGVEEIIERSVADKDWDNVKTVADVYKIAGC